jgi:predicted metal-binding membrane protein
MPLSADTTSRATGPALAGVASLLSQPRLIALGCMSILTTCGWIYLVWIAMAKGQPGAAAWLDAICRAAPVAAIGIETASVVAAMWLAMTLAMMLPSAGPMILTYAEIADTALRKGETIVSPHVLIAGYLAVWFGFAALATFVQIGLGLIAAWPLMAAAAAPASAILFLVAGFYQFSALKQACLRACQQPFSFFFLNWTDRTSGVFRLGVRQGLYCLGCCWAMMLLMLVAGAMNLFWMALLGLIMLVEKMTVAPYVGRAVGVAFIAAGLTMLASWGASVLH